MKFGVLVAMILCIVSVHSEMIHLDLRDNQDRFQTVKTFVGDEVELGNYLKTISQKLTFSYSFE